MDFSIFCGGLHISANTTMLFGPLTELTKNICEPGANEAVIVRRLLRITQPSELQKTLYKPFLSCVTEFHTKNMSNALCHMVADNFRNFPVGLDY